MAINSTPNFRMPIESVVFLLSAVFYSISAYGNTCFSDERTIKELSKIHLDKISFSVNSSEQEIDVILKLPSQINGADLSSTLLGKQVPSIDHETEFLFPLKIQKEDGNPVVWYMLSKSMSDHNFIQAYFGDECGWLIEYELDYEGEKLKLKSLVENN